ncbi:MAG: sigma-70 family RNA polymerase sigma factor [Planctomycetes bacterium]|nr:sigma-70 family RNA polymerase sigma factor [Planctomycetota bacterium]
MATASLSRMVRHLRQNETDRSGDRPDRELLERHLAGEPGAFERLVWRHGRAVLGVCRSVLGHEADAEDAFQATFLTLLRGACSIRQRDAVGGWLCGVAYRVAVKALHAAGRRRRHEHRAAQAETVSASPDLSWREACAALHEELDRLPEKFRLPLVHCYLQGLSRDEAARQLGSTLQSLKGRLERGRLLLRDRLARRGITLSAGLLAALGDSATASAVPPRLIQATLQAVTGRVPAAVANLIEGATRAMSPKLSFTAGLLVIAGLLMIGTALRGSLSAALPNDPPTPKVVPLPRQAEPAKADKPERSEAILCTGRVLGPDGKPVAGAKLFLRIRDPWEKKLPVRATSDKEGKFDFAFKRSELDANGYAGPWFQLIATADGYAPDWSYGDNPAAKIERTLRLAEDIPIRGRILDLNGKPVAGATLRLEEIHAYADPEAFLQTVRDRQWPRIDGKYWNGPFPGQPKVFTTGADGRFRLTGIGRDRVIQFQLEGPGIEYGPVRVVVRDMKTAVEPKQKGRFAGPVIHKVYGATFTHAALPSRLIRGVVHDKKTGKPVAGVQIYSGRFRVVTDAEGRYEVLGHAKSTEGYSVSASPVGKPYFSLGIQVADTPGLGPVQADIDLVTGIVVRGRVTHAVTGKPIAGAGVHHNPLYPNPAVRLFGPNGAGTSPCSWTLSGADGSYSLVILPGPGILGFIDNARKESLMTALITRQDLKDFFKDNEDHGNEDSLRIQAGVNSWTVVGQNQFSRLLLINPGANPGPITQDVGLRPALAVRGKVVGPDGKPLTGVVAHGLMQEWAYASEPLKDDTFAVRSFNPRRPRNLVFTHAARKLGAFVTVAGERKDPLVVKLEPLGSITGCILDEDGKPVAGMTVRLDCEHLFYEAGPRVKTDRDGRFRIDGLVAGQRYQARLGLPPFGKYLFAPFTVKPGENRNLGEMKLAPSGTGN